MTRSLVIAVLPVLVFSHHTYMEGLLLDTLLETTGLVLLLAGASGRVWAALYICGRKNVELVREGPYSMVRNPLYLFSLMAFLGAGLAFGSVLLALILALVFAVCHWPAIRKEEQHLLSLFGSDFERYRREVPRFLPRIGVPRRPEIVSVCPRTFTRSMREAGLLPLIFVGAQLLEWAKLSELLPVLFLLP